MATATINSETERYQRRILIAEDEAAIRMLYKECIFDDYAETHKVEFYSNGKDLLKTLRENPFDVALVLTDENMPEGIKGSDVAREFGSELPVILCSSECNSNNFRRYGVSTYVGKPFDIPNLKDSVRSTLDDWSS